MGFKVNKGDGVAVDGQACGGNRLRVEFDNDVDQLAEDEETPA